MAKFQTKRIGYFDIETADWTHFVVGGTLLDGQIRITWHDSRAFVESMLIEPNVEWRAHNGGKFDFLLVLQWAQRFGFSIKTVMRGSFVLKAVVSDGSRESVFVDTVALAPTSLSKFAKAAGGIQKGEFDYDRIEPGLDPNSATGNELREYLEHDLLSLCDADNAWRKVLRDIAGVDPSLTLGGTAWKSAAKYAVRSGEDVKAPLSETQYEYGRAGYFGGRVEVFRQYAPKAFTCDRNSSYPAALTKQPVPCGHRIWKRTLEGDGTVWARVKVPECQIPPLPLRYRGRLAFPVGEFDGVWTLLELRNAMRLGVSVVKVYKARVAQNTTTVLGEWCQRVWNARASMPDWSPLLKLLANSLTGKLAQQPEKTTLGYADIRDLPPGARHMTPIDANEKVWFAASKVEVSPCARPEWSAYLTAEARIELLEQLHATKGGAVYCDTDSVFSTKPNTRNIGLDLGQWKNEGEITNWESHGPKFYKYDKGEKQVSKVKGQSGITRAGFDSLVELIETNGDSGSPWERRAGAMSLKQTISQTGTVRFATRATTKGGKRIEGWVGSRLATARGETRAPTIGKLATRFGSQD